MDDERVADPGADDARDSRLDFFSRDFDAALALSIQSLQPPNPKARTSESHQIEYMAGERAL